MRRFPQMPRTCLNRRKSPFQRHGAKKRHNQHLLPVVRPVALFGGTPPHTKQAHPMLPGQDIVCTKRKGARNPESTLWGATRTACAPHPPFWGAVVPEEARIFRFPYPNPNFARATLKFQTLGNNTPCRFDKGRWSRALWEDTRSERCVENALVVG